MSWYVPHCIFKRADKEQQRGLEPAPESGCPLHPEVVQKPNFLLLLNHHTPEASGLGGHMPKM